MIIKSIDIYKNIVIELLILPIYYDIINFKLNDICFKYHLILVFIILNISRINTNSKNYAIVIGMTLACMNFREEEETENKI